MTSLSFWDVMFPGAEFRFVFWGARFAYLPPKRNGWFTWSHHPELKRNIIWTKPSWLWVPAVGFCRCSYKSLVTRRKCFAIEKSMESNQTPRPKATRFSARSGAAATGLTEWSAIERYTPEKLTAGYPKWWFGNGDSETPIKYGHFCYLY